MGIVSMLDLAGSFDTEEEVRSVLRNTDRIGADLAAAAWRQAKQRASGITSDLAAHSAKFRRPPGPSIFSSTITAPHTIPPRAPQPPPPRPVPYTPFAPAPAVADRAVVQLRDQQVEQAKAGHINALIDLYLELGPAGLQWEEVSAADLPNK